MLESPWVISNHCLFDFLLLKHPQWKIVIQVDDDLLIPLGSGLTVYVFLLLKRNTERLTQAPRSGLGGNEQVKRKRNLTPSGKFL